MTDSQSPARAIDADVAALSYEQARDELQHVVTTLESGQPGLEESMAMWHRGEQLALHCERLLDQAQSTLDGAADVPA